MMKTISKLLAGGAFLWAAALPMQAQKNPILPEWHADPDVIADGGRYYIYSTTDGAPGWGGYFFTCYSSKNLKDWRYEGTILDLKKDTKLAKGNAWAPAIEKKNGKFYFYFSGDQGERKAIGVAVAEKPTGPFTDFGNGYMAGAKLNDDMTSIDESSVTVMTPRGGTLQDYAYREAPYVFKRKGTYYFLWSVDDTGSPNYHVAYGTAKSSLGPIEVAKDPVILQQRPEQGIYGTAHNSVVQIPGKDKWYIVYHRINKHYLDRKDGPGFHREVCIDPMEFETDGRIKAVTPTN